MSQPHVACLRFVCLGILEAVSCAVGHGLGESDGRGAALGLPQGARRKLQHHAGLSGKTSLRYLCETPPGDSKISGGLGLRTVQGGEVAEGSLW